MVILGSGMIVQQLANLNLIDELSFMVHPLVLGTGDSCSMASAIG